MYAFATWQIVDEVPSMMLERTYLWNLLGRLLTFPDVYTNWERVETCAVDEVTLGPSSTSLDPVQQVPKPASVSDADLVDACSELLDDYGLSIIARAPADSDAADGTVVGTATLRAKRLPEGCHIREEDPESGPAVVCNPDLDAIYEAEGLEGVAYLETIAVDTAWRGTGLAERMLQFVEDKSRAWGFTAMSLHVHRDNWGALTFYKRRGYEATSDWLGYGDRFFLLLKPL